MLYFVTGIAADGLPSLYFPGQKATESAPFMNFSLRGGQGSQCLPLVVFIMVRSDLRYHYFHAAKRLVLVKFSLSGTISRYERFQTAARTA